MERWAIKYIGWTLSFILVWILSASAAAQHVSPVVKLDGSSHFHLPLRDTVQYWIDPDNVATLQTLPTDPGQWQNVTTKYIDFGLSPGRVWVRQAVQNATPDRQSWRLDINRQYYSSMNIYLRREAGETDQAVTPLMTHTKNDDYFDRPVIGRMLAADFSLDPGERGELILSYTSETTTYLPMAIGSVDAVRDRLTRGSQLDWTLNGALLAFTIFALMVAPIISWPLATRFCLYILAGFLYVFHADGYTHALFWPTRMWLNDPMNLTFILLMPVAGLMFARSLFDFKTAAPRLDKLLFVFAMLALICALLAIPIYRVEWVKVLAYFLVPTGAILQVGAGVTALRRKLLGALPYTVGASGVLLSMAYATLAHVQPGAYNLDWTLDFGHFILLFECLAFSIAIVLRLIGLRDERDSAIRAELGATRESLKLSDRLRTAQDQYIDVRKKLDRRRHRTSAVSHDLQQPLMSLRTALSHVDPTNEETTQQLHSALDYLEKLTRQALPATGYEDPIPALETFPIRAVTDNVYDMFRGEAEKHGMTLRYRPLEAVVQAEPIALMRTIGNLVTNAIKHGGRGDILLALRPRGSEIRVEIWDQGVGMDAAELARYLGSGEKGDASDGQGLGLALVKETAATMGWGLDIQSRAGRGTRATLTIQTQ